MPLEGNDDIGVQGRCAESFVFVSSQNDRMLRSATEALLGCYDRIASNPGHTPQEYWKSQGSRGASQVQVFGIWKQALVALHQAVGEQLPLNLASLGESLDVNQDGTVTVQS